MRTTFLACLAVAALACVGCTALEPPLAAQPASSGESFTLAILRRDGVLLPFAGFERGKWRNRWPLAGARVDLPIAFDQCPRSWWIDEQPAATWTAWPVGADSRTVHVNAVVTVRVQCARYVGLRTDYVSSQPRALPDMQPYPKDGLATTGHVLIEPVAVLDMTSSDWKEALTAIGPDFNRLETKLLQARRGPEVPFPRTEQERAGTAISIEVLFRTPGAKPGTRRLYFEAVRRYGKQPAARSYPQPLSLAPGPCPALTYAGGWIVLEAGQAPRVDMEAALSDCDREGLMYTLPLGTFLAGGRRYWAVQRAGWGMERYDIIEIGDDPKIRNKTFTTHGGYCQ